MPRPEALLGPLGESGCHARCRSRTRAGRGAALVRVENALLLSEEVCDGGEAGAPFAAARAGVANLFVIQMQGWKLHRGARQCRTGLGRDVLR